MISLEQVLLLETRVAKAIDYVKKVTADNAELVRQKEELVAKLEANQKRIDELEVHVMRFKDEQGRIEDGIVAALDRLSQFEEAFENSLKDKPLAAPAAEKKQTHDAGQSLAEQTPREVFFEIPAGETKENELDIF